MQRYRIEYKVKVVTVKDGTPVTTEEIRAEYVNAPGLNHAIEIAEMFKKPIVKVKWCGKARSLPSEVWVRRALKDPAWFKGGRRC